MQDALSRLMPVLSITICGYLSKIVRILSALSRQKRSVAAASNRTLIGEFVGDNRAAIIGTASAVVVGKTEGGCLCDAPEIPCIDAASLCIPACPSAACRFARCYPWVSAVVVGLQLPAFAAVRSVGVVTPAGKDGDTPSVLSCPATVPKP